ncbi:MAG TPA: hypothetical protein VGJ84_19220 [Polyangiaceae bacterium]
MQKRSVEFCLLVLALSSFACSGSSDSASSGGASNGGGGTYGAGGSSRGGTSSGATAGSAQGGFTSAGSSGQGGSISSAGSGGSPPVFQPSWKVCSVDADCVVFDQNTCCGCVVVSVNRQFEQEARAASPSATNCPSGLGCASRPCPTDAIGACKQGVCDYEVPCGTRDVMACGSDGYCRSLSGQACGSTTWETLGCLSWDIGCDTVVTCAVDPASGIQYQFPDSCIPQSWAACPSSCP